LSRATHPACRATAVIADNLLDRDFQADRPNQKWLADFTCIWTAEGWLYVTVVLDLFSRRVVGWSMKGESSSSNSLGGSSPSAADPGQNGSDQRALVLLEN
jgi:transposase InsO family protein